MISLLKRYQRSLAWFVSGLVAVVLLSLGSAKQPQIASNGNNFTVSSQVQAHTDFAASHLEPNFYQ